MQESKTIDMEMRILYLEDSLNEINKAMVEQQAQIELLTKRNTFLNNKIQDLTEMLQDEPLNQKPPHY